MHKNPIEFGLTRGKKKKKKSLKEEGRGRDRGEKKGIPLRRTTTNG
jgi:hypothetical protein